MMMIIICIGRFKPIPKEIEVYEPNHIVWIDEWLENPVCKPPCLDNIIPGISTSSEVEEKLLTHPGVFKLSRDSSNYYTESIYWHIPECEGVELGEVLLEKETKIVKKIIIRNHICKAKIPLEIFINTFGEPDYIYPIRDLNSINSKCSLADLFYLDSGMRVLLESPNLSKEDTIQISSSSLIYRIILFEPQKDLETTLDYQTQIFIPLDAEVFQVSPWNGFTEYRCND